MKPIKTTIVLLLLMSLLLTNNSFGQKGIIGKAVMMGSNVASGEIIPKKNTPAKKQALFILNFFKYITWPDKDSNDVFNISVLGDSGDVLLSELKLMANELSNTKKGKKLTFNIHRINTLAEVDDVQILYFDQSSELKLENVYEKINKSSTLVVTQGYPFGKSMINFVMDGDKVLYELNEKRCNDAGLEVSWILSKVAIKSEKEWDSLIEKMENLADTDDKTIEIDKKDLQKIVNEQKRLLAEIEINTEKLYAQKATLKVQQAELAAKEKLIANAKKEIDAQQALIDDQLQKIEIQQTNLTNLNSNVEAKHDELVAEQKKLEEEKKSLLAIQTEYADIESKLKDKELLVKEQHSKIDEQIDDIFKKSNTIEEQESIIWLSVLFLVIVSILGGLAYRSYRLKNKANITIMAQKAEIEEQHDVLEEQHKEITDSINYAKRIQDAILPPLKLVRGYMPDSFIYYKPKDIIAGDFYWMESINNLIIFATADCTGHGVPGAMVSVVCHNAMNRSVKEFMLVKPNDILNKTREIVLETFEKSDEDVNDGMDIALCSINLESKKLNFSGANNGLYLFRNNELIEIKPDKQPIGNYADAKPFTNHEMDLEKGDVLYTFSDGYPDQFGGPKGKKFMYKQFRNLLLEIHQKPMDDQYKLLHNTFEEWRGDLEQIDDVCIIGVRI